MCEHLLREQKVNNRCNILTWRSPLYFIKSYTSLISAKAQASERWKLDDEKEEKLDVKLFLSQSSMFKLMTGVDLMKSSDDLALRQPWRQFLAVKQEFITQKMCSMSKFSVKLLLAECE